MTFTTPAFLVFLVVVWTLYWCLQRKAQNWLILLASLFFYACWDWRFLFLLFFNAGIDYIAARFMQNAASEKTRKLWLLLSLFSNLGVLGFFKYFNFFTTSLVGLLGGLGLKTNPVLLQVILPLGISFYTFQALSYTIDVYRRRIEAVRDPIAYFSFICFFPHMVAGPIQQAKHLLVQFERDRHFDRAFATDGAQQMLWGFFKKMVIADNLAPIVNQAFADPSAVSGWQLWWATYCFAWQIYCDFSGYTDIAIGCARLFGFDMTRNFAYPYFSRSIAEFWRRWHITLSNWFRDYLYIPLGGNRVAPLRHWFNVIVVFVASGLWHGANWTFMFWGLWHGVLALAPPPRFEDASDHPALDTPGGERLWPSMRSLFWMIVTFHLVCVGWIFFRAQSLPEAVLVLQKIGAAALSGHFDKPEKTGAIIYIVVLLVIEWLQRRHRHPLQIDAWPRPLRWATYGLLVYIIFMFAELNYTPFIYFQF
jgi:D-alanyl-lipoteichoic acid acyltransferase DltB (MBOAT superfamily)